MKILHLFDFFSPLGGGLVDVVYKLSGIQAQRGHDVTIYTSDYRLDTGYISSLPQVKIKTFHCLMNLTGFFIMPGIIRALRENINNFDILHVHAARSFQNIFVRRYAKKHGIPYVLSSHGSLVRSAQGGRGLKWYLKWLFDVFWGYRILRDASMVVALNEFGAREYESFGVKREKIVLLPHFFPVEDYTQIPAAGGFRGKYNLGEKHIIMSIGRIHWIKGLDSLVDAFYELSRLRDDVLLVIVGADDGYKPALVKQIERLGLSDRVLFPGFLSGQDKLSALVDADVVVQPSRYEIAAWAPVEAIICGTPVIASKNTGSGEDLAGMGMDYLVSFRDTKQMVADIQSILDDPSPARAKVKAAITYINTNLKLSKNVEGYEKLYQQCVENAGRKKV
jgi:glycosyltransferase involved in cell wall biosynthesis